MAVTYQYQNDYDNKQTNKGNKKKLIILAIGLVVVGGLLMIFAPKKQAVDTNKASDVAKTELPTKSGYVLDDQQKKIKLETDGFLLSLINKTDYKDFMVPIVYQAITGKPELLDTLKGLSLETCELQNIELAKQQINISTYGCTGFNLFVSTSAIKDSRVENKVINWKIMEIK